MLSFYHHVDDLIALLVPQHFHRPPRFGAAADMTPQPSPFVAGTLFSATRAVNGRVATLLGLPRVHRQRRPRFVALVAERIE